MKKILIVPLVLLFVFAFSIDAFSTKKTITVTVEGDKVGPTTINPNGTVTVDCDVSIATCARVKFEIEESANAPSVGDFTEVDTYGDEGTRSFRGYFLSEEFIDNGESIEYSLTLSDLEEL